MRIITAVAIIISAFFIYEILSNITHKEPFTKQVDIGRAEYNKHMRGIRRVASDTTKTLRAHVKRAIRQAGF